MIDEIENIKKQHFDSYKASVLSNLEYNSNSLFKEDIHSLVKKPPLGSMDNIKNKILELSKKNSLVLDNEKLDYILDSFRSVIIDQLDGLSMKRIEYYSEIINSIERKDDNTVIKLAKKDFNTFNKSINKELKEIVNQNIELLINNLKDMFGDNYNSKIESTISKFLKKDYFNSLFDNIDMKIMVKDATFINTIKEETERYQFTLDNSRLFK